MGLVGRMQAFGPTAVLLQAAGRLEVPLASALAASARPAVVVNPRQAPHFGKDAGRLAKTDALDDQALAHFAEAVRTRASSKPAFKTQIEPRFKSAKPHSASLLYGPTMPWIDHGEAARNSTLLMGAVQKRCGMKAKTQ